MLDTSNTERSSVVDVCGLQWDCHAEGDNGRLAQHVAAYEILRKLSSVGLLTDDQASQVAEEDASPYGWYNYDTDGVRVMASRDRLYSSADPDQHLPSSDLVEAIKVRSLHDPKVLEPLA